MFETYDGLSKDYEVSCRELNFLVDAVRQNENVKGARTMGEGFGRCSINIVRHEYVETLIKTINENNVREMNLPLTAIVANVVEGTNIM
jgi:galactokinase